MTFQLLSSVGVLTPFQPCSNPSKWLILPVPAGFFQLGCSEGLPTPSNPRKPLISLFQPPACPNPIYFVYRRAAAPSLARPDDNSEAGGRSIFTKALTVSSLPIRALTVEIPLFPSEAHCGRCKRLISNQNAYARWYSCLEWSWK
jgi:hypothetical protein